MKAASMLRPAISIVTITLMAALPARAATNGPATVGTGVKASTLSNSASRPIRFAETPAAGSILVIPVDSADSLQKIAAVLPAETIAAIRSGMAAAQFTPNKGNTLPLYNIGAYKQILISGMKPVHGSSGPLDRQDAAGTAIQLLADVRAPVSILATGMDDGAAADFALGADLGQYRYDRLKKATRKDRPADAITIVTSDPLARAQFEQDLQHLSQAVTWARDLQTAPANEIYPETFVSAVQEAFRGLRNVRITILDEEAMRTRGMGALLGVGQGSRRPSRLVAVEFRGAGDDAPIALVGKGITFDTGGISLKPPAGMWEMKGDMSGAAATIGATLAAARRQAKVNLVAVAALAENMAGAGAQRPGDVVRTMSGQTIEIINTDAEGRLVLADANQWTAATYKPSAIVNIATLTGAIVNALGDEYAGLFARDDALADRLKAAGDASGESLWRMPLHPSYAGDMASEIADIKNANEGGRAGAGTAAWFLSYLTPEGTPWAHIDMAAMDRATTAMPTVPKGPRGYGVRLLDQLVRSYEQR